MISFILPKPKRNCSGVIPLDEFFPLPSVTSINYMSAPSSSFRLSLKKWPEKSTPRRQSAWARGLKPVSSQALRRHQFISIAEWYVWSLINDKSRRVWAWHDLNVIFSIESGLFIWGGGVSPLEKPQLPFKQNCCGRGQDTLRMSLLFSGGQQKPIVTCWNFSHQNKHMLGAYLFLMSWM